MNPTYLSLMAGFSFGLFVGAVIAAVIVGKLLDTRHAAELDRFASMSLTGRPEIPLSQVIEPLPDAEQRLIFHTHEQTVQRGIEVMTAEYREMGLGYSAEEIRDHVETMLRGEQIQS